MRHLSLHFDLSIIANFESVQTIKDKQSTYYSNSSKWCSLVLTEAWSRFLHWSMALVIWKSAETLITRGFSSGRVLASCIRAAAWCCCCHRNGAVGTQPISSFSNAVNPQLNADASSEKFFHNWPILMKLYQPVLGVWFFLKHSVYIISAVWAGKS